MAEGPFSTMVLRKRSNRIISTVCFNPFDVVKEVWLIDVAKKDSGWRILGWKMERKRGIKRSASEIMTLKANVAKRSLNQKELVM